jgi:hypothetical protein
MAQKLYWIKQRSNPQLDKVFFVPLGQLSIADAKKHEKTLYGSNVMLRFKTEAEYKAAAMDLCGR